MKKNSNKGNSTTTGLKFEKNVNLNDSLLKEGYTINNDNIEKIYLNGELIGYSLQKNSLYKWLINQGINWKNLISKKLLPDDCFYNIKTDTIYILEKKYQQTTGSVDEKPQTCGFKMFEYKKLFNNKISNIKFCYIFNDWFKKDEYKDMLEYIKLNDCEYFFNEIPLNYLGLE